MDRVTVDGLAIAFERRGDGPPLVLVLGALGDHRDWLDLVEDLSDAFTTIAWDAPGCGASDDPPSTFRMPGYADALAGLVTAIGVAPAHVLGLSFGSVVSLALAERHPALVRSLVLAGPYAGWAGSLPPEVVADRLASNLALLEEGGIEGMVRAWVSTILPPSAPAEEVEEYVRESIPTIHEDGIRPMLFAVAEADLRPALPRIAVPTLIVRGEDDVRSPLEASIAIRDAMPNATLERIPDAGHAVDADAPEAFNAAVRAFLLAH